MILLDGNVASSAMKKEIAQQVKDLISFGKRVPHLAAVLVGDNGASQTYVNAKVNACTEVGFRSTLIEEPASITEEKLIQIVQALNTDSDIDGYIVQLPLPSHINESRILLAIDPAKDVDGFHPENIGRMALNLPGFIPATPYGILRLLEHFHVETEGKSAVVVGRSHIVGLPMAILLQRNAYPGNATVTIAHSRTKHLDTLCRSADILIAAIGKPNFITEKMVKKDAVIVDVGITRVADASKKSGFRLVGDVHFEKVAPLASFITPVPGGVGPMTIAALLSNTMYVLKNRQ